ncbi:unnamed protein product [Linum trigynum]|uniref:Uncharacterized protein n=1 Tax=Linum trigynum TaxID=586398 RepID=A0AAV2DUW5_9ROSI
MFATECSGLVRAKQAEGGVADDGKPPLWKNLVSITWLVVAIKKNDNPNDDGISLSEESDERDKKIYACDYHISKIGGVFFPKKSNNLISNAWLKILLGPREDMGNLSLASACLARI